MTKFWNKDLDMEPSGLAKNWIFSSARDAANTLTTMLSLVSLAATTYVCMYGCMYVLSSTYIGRCDALKVNGTRMHVRVLTTHTHMRLRGAFIPNNTFTWRTERMHLMQELAKLKMSTIPCSLCECTYVSHCMGRPALRYLCCCMQMMVEKQNMAWNKAPERATLPYRTSSFGYVHPTAMNCNSCSEQQPAEKGFGSGLSLRHS